MTILKRTNLVWVVLVAALMTVAAARPAAAELTPEQVAAEAARYQALGAVYSAEGFTGFPSKETPFYGHPGYGYSRLTQIRHRGKLVHEDKSGTGIGHSFACGRFGTIYLELWLPGGEKGMTPFAWQDLFALCQNGGEPSGSDPLYVDITGDGKPEIKFASVDAISSLVHQDGVKKRVFSVDLIPAWVKDRLGAEFVEGRGGLAPGPAWIEPVYRHRIRPR